MADPLITQRLNEAVGAAVADAASRLSMGTVELPTLREKNLSAVFASSLSDHVDETVRENRTIKLEHFPRVGRADIAGYREGEDFAFLAELKWSTSTRDKIFEAAWDAVKLALARAQLGLDAAWLVTGAPIAAWKKTECGDLFADGEVSVRELWDRPLNPPGPNGGTTVGDDLEIGGRGNMFSAAPERLALRVVAKVPITRGSALWELRATDVQALTQAFPFVRRLDPAKLSIPAPAHVPGAAFPKQIGQRWLERNVPHLDNHEFERLLESLRLSNWTNADLQERVYPLRKNAEA